MRGVCLSRPGRFGLLVGATAFVVTLETVMLHREEWVGWLPTTIGVLGVATVWVPSMVATAAAWMSGQPRAHGLAEWVSTSPRSAGDRLMVPALVSGIAGVVALLLAVVFVVVESVTKGLGDGGFSGAPVVLWVPTMLAYLAFWAVVGSAAGELLPRTAALALAVLAPYAAYAVLDVYADGLPLAALAVNGTRAYDYVLPSTDSLVTRLAFWVVAATVAALLVAGRRRLAKAAAWAASVAAACALFIGPQYVPIAGAGTPVCEGSAPRLCLDGSFRSAMPRYRAAVSDVWAAVPLALRPDVVASSDAAADGAAGDVLVAAPVAGVTSPARLVDQKMFAAAFGSALLEARCTDSTGGQDEAIVLERWWRGTHGVPVDRAAFVGDSVLDARDVDLALHVREAKALAAAPPQLREKWFRDNAEAIRSCMPSTPFPSP